jgi:DnaJ-class molecular chaperone
MALTAKQRHHRGEVRRRRARVRFNRTAGPRERQEDRRRRGLSNSAPELRGEGWLEADDIVGGRRMPSRISGWVACPRCKGAGAKVNSRGDAVRCHRCRGTGGGLVSESQKLKGIAGAVR